MGVESREPFSSSSREGWSWPEPSALPPLRSGALLELSRSSFGREVALSFHISLTKGGVFLNSTERELWERWHCIYSPAPQAQKGLLLPGLPRVRPGAAARPPGCPGSRPGLGRGLQSQASLALELRRQYFNNLSLPPHCSRQHPRPPGPGPSAHSSFRPRFGRACGRPRRWRPQGERSRKPTSLGET